MSEKITVAVTTTRDALEALLNPSPSPHAMLTGLEDLRAALERHDAAPGRLDGMRLVVAAHVAEDPDLDAITRALAPSKSDGTTGTAWAMDLTESVENIAAVILMLTACRLDGPLEAVMRLAPNAAAATALLQERLGDDDEDEEAA